VAEEVTRNETEEVCAMDEEKGPLIVRPARGALTVRLALFRRDGRMVYATYTRTDERDAAERPIYR
jgi:hypothetical protein